MPYTLSNGHVLPEIGLGTFRIPDGSAVTESVSIAIENGYRNIDTATLYDNETGIGNALKSTNLPREQFTVTTKVWNTDQGFDSTLVAFEQSKRKLRLDYVDLYLVHWPIKAKLRDTWRALERLYSDGQVKAIGVSNFSVEHLKMLMDFTSIMPVVNQIEFHPRLQSPELVQFCKVNDILVQAWAPLMRGQCERLPTLNKIALNHRTSPEAVCLAWIKSQRIMSLPKSSHSMRIRSNIQACDLTLSQAEINAISEIDSDHRLGPPLNHFWL